MGRFAQTFKDVEQYDDGDCYMRSVPVGMPDALAALLSAACGPEGDDATVKMMKAVANDLLSMAGKKPTTNWEAGALRTDIKSGYHMLREAGFDKFMDATLNVSERLHRPRVATARLELLRDLNDVLLGANFGYTLRSVEATERLTWEGRSEASVGASALTAAAEALKDVSSEAIEHLEQAKAHLLTPNKPRSRKDAVRDAMSAMEAMTKKVAGDGDFADACRKLREEHVWGTDQIVKDGRTVWDHLHRLYPDIRHGQPTGSDLDLEEALYWIDRITSYVRYIAARKRALGR